MNEIEKKYDIAVVGATGLVGQAMLAILEERRFPIGRLYPLASSRSAGSKIPFQGDLLTVGDLSDFDFSQAQIGLFSAGADVSARYAIKAAQSGCVVIDNTSQFRYEQDIPLIIPEVNPKAIAGYRSRGIIANPNCSTIQMLVALKPIYDAVGIERINVATYQAVSGSGKKAVEELTKQTSALLDGSSRVRCQVYPKQIAFNALPHIDVFQDNGYTKEEMKMVWETQKIMGDDTIKVNPTAVRIPVFYGHSEALHIETKTPVSAEKAREILNRSPGVTVWDERSDGGYPTACDGAGNDMTYVGRIRSEIDNPCGLNLWVVSDNIRKGAALNSVQIGEFLVKNYI